MPALASELRVDATYRNTNNWRDDQDVFNRLFRFTDGKGINNTSGFRPKSKGGGSTDILDCAFCVLVTNFGETEWPDALNRETGTFVYYGDNRSAGRPIHETAVGGNRLLEKVFELARTGDRSAIPPFLCFEKFKTDEGTQMRFLGLACPGAQGLAGVDDLVAVWRVHSNVRFQNYRAVFTILSEPSVARSWLQDLVDGLKPADSLVCPPSWRTWVRSGTYTPLRCARRRLPRTRAQQMPQSAIERRILSRIFEELSPREFEFFAAELIAMMDDRFTEIVVTKAVRDGGRDVLAKYRVGHDLHQVLLEAYVEAKKWDPDSAVGTKPMMRLVSRLKHRDLGVFVTTSFFDRQVQKELIEDNHPVLLVSGGDIARILVAAQIGADDAADRLTEWIGRIRSTAQGQLAMASAQVPSVESVSPESAGAGES